MPRTAIAALLVSGLVALALGCEDGTDVDESAVTDIAGEDLVMVNCEVCGDHEFAKRPDTPVLDYEGKTYHFCVEACKTRFEEDPERYVVSDAPATRPAGA